MSFKVYSFVTVVFVNNHDPKRIFFALLMPLYFFIDILRPKTLNFVNKSFNFLHFGFLIVICELHNSPINNSALSDQHPSKIPNFIERI